jgi:hypothetical protein
MSLQTGCAYAQSHFLDNEGNDAKRIDIFFFDERQWRAIRDRVREWVLSMYVVWKALAPSWFTTDLQARIPDEFMPAQVVHELNAQAPNGRRRTVQDMGLLRRVSRIAVVTTEDSSNSDGALHIPAPYLEPTSPQSAGAEGLHSKNRGAEAELLEEAASTRSALKPGNCGLALRDMLELRDSYDLIYTPKIWTARDERNLNPTASAEVSELVPSCVAQHSAMPRCKCHQQGLWMRVNVRQCTNMHIRADGRSDQRRANHQARERGRRADHRVRPRRHVHVPFIPRRRHPQPRVGAGGASAAPMARPFLAGVC